MKKMNKRIVCSLSFANRSRRRILREAAALILMLAVTLQTIPALAPGQGSVKAGDALTEEEGGIGWKVANAALSYLGYSYEMNDKRDGSPESGYTFDCSGLIYTALRDAGITGLTSAYPTMEVWSTSDWNNAIGNRSLGLSKAGQPLTIRYAERLEEYKSVLKEHRSDSVIIYTGTDADTASLRREDLLRTGDLVITRNDPQGNHAQIVLGSYPYRGSGHEGVMQYFADSLSSLAEAFPNTLNARLASGVPVLVDDDPAVYRKTGILTKMQPLARYSTTYAGQERYASGIRPAWLAMLNLETVGGEVSPGNNPVWVVDDASKDSGVRLTNRLMGKSAVSYAYVIHFPEARQCSASIRVLKTAEQEEGNFVPNADAVFTMYTDANCTKDARVLKRGESDPEGVYSYEWKDRKEWNDYFHLTGDEGAWESRTVYIRETKAPTGHLVNPSVFRVVITPAKERDRSEESSAVFYAGATGSSANTLLGTQTNQSFQAYYDSVREALAVRDLWQRRSGSMGCGVNKELENGAGAITAQFLVSGRGSLPAKSPKEAVRISALGWDSAAVVASPYRYSVPNGNTTAMVSDLIPGTWYYAKILKEQGVKDLSSGAELTMDPAFYCAVMRITVSPEGTVSSDTSYGKADSLEEMLNGSWKDASSQTVTDSSGLKVLTIRNRIDSEQIRFSTRIFKFGNTPDDPLSATFTAGAYSESIREAISSYRESPEVIRTAGDGYTPEQRSSLCRIPAGDTLVRYRIYREKEVLTGREGVTFQTDPHYYLAEVSATADRYGKAGAQKTVWYENDTLSETGWVRLPESGKETSVSGTGAAAPGPEASASGELLRLPNQSSIRAPLAAGIYKYGDNDPERPLDARFRISRTEQDLSAAIRDFDGTLASEYYLIQTGEGGVRIFRGEFGGLSASATHHRYRIFREESVKDSAGLSFQTDPNYYLADMYVTLDTKGLVTASGVRYYRSEILSEAQSSMNGWSRIRDVSEHEGVACLNINDLPDLHYEMGYRLVKTDEDGRPVGAEFAFVTSEITALTEEEGEKLFLSVSQEKETLTDVDLLAGQNYFNVLEEGIRSGEAETFEMIPGKERMEEFAKDHCSDHALTKILVFREVSSEADHRLDESYYAIRMTGLLDRNTGKIRNFTDYFRSEDGEKWEFLLREDWSGFSSYGAYAEAEENENDPAGFDLVNYRYSRKMVPVEGTKVFVTGSERGILAGEFSFRITQTGAPNSTYEGFFADQIAETDEQGRFHFPEEYEFLYDPGAGIDMCGVWTFEVTEEVPGDTASGSKGILYSAETYELKILVEMTEEGVLEAKQEILRKEHGKEEAAEELLFTNYYKAEADAEFMMMKEFEKVPSGGEFRFDVILTGSTAGPFGDGRGALGKDSGIEQLVTLLSREDVRNNSGGEIFVPAFHFEKNTQTDVDMTGKYFFLVRERRGNETFISYDLSEYRFTLEVRDDLHGSLLVSILDQNGDPLTGEPVVATFRNGYLSEGVLSFAGRKEMENDPESKLDEYTFDLVNTSWPDGAEQIPSQSTQNHENGYFAFDEIRFAADSMDRSALGTYVFEITERAGTREDVVYSEQKYVYEVTVADEVTAYNSENAGRLTVRKKLLSGGGDPDRDSAKLPEDLDALFVNQKIVTETPTPTPTTVPTATPSVTPASRPSETPVPDTPTPTASVTPRPTGPAPSVTPVPEEFVTPVPTPEVKPSETPTPVPSKPPILGITAHHEAFGLLLLTLGMLAFGGAIFVLRRRTRSESR